MGLILALLAALTFAPVSDGATLRTPIAATLTQASAASAAQCRRIGEPPRGNSGYVFGMSDRQVDALSFQEAARCLSAVWHPDAAAGALRVVQKYAVTPADALSAAEWMGLCGDGGSACALLQCEVAVDGKRRVACLDRLKDRGGERMAVRHRAAVAKLRLDPDTYATLIDMRLAFTRLADAGYYPALAELALVEYRLTNLDSAYQTALRGATYRLPEAEALAAFLKVEGFGDTWDLTTALDLARDAGGHGEGVLRTDISTFFTAEHWLMLQTAMIARGLHPGPAGAPFRESWYEALDEYAAAHALPPGITLGTLDALGILRAVSLTGHVKPTIRRD